MSLNANTVQRNIQNVGCALTPSCCCSNLIFSISSTALFIIGAMTVAGAIPMGTAGWLTVGFGSGLLIGNLGMGDLSKEGLKNRKWMLIIGSLTAISVILVGALGLAGVGAVAATKALGITVLVISLLNPTYSAFCCGDMAPKAVQQLANDDD